MYALTNQMRRAAISIPSNINFLCIARGSLSELETQAVIARDLGYLADMTAIENRMDQVFRLLEGLINSLRRPEPTRALEACTRAGIRASRFRVEFEELV
jgi:four helix bundle protein